MRVGVDLSLMSHARQQAGRGAWALCSAPEVWSILLHPRRPRYCMLEHQGWAEFRLRIEPSAVSSPRQPG
jgi:hypothetical protein